MGREPPRGTGLLSPMRLATAVLLIGLLSAATPAASQSTAQRLELLERRVNRITDLTLQLDQVRRENQQLRGEIENLGYEIERLKRKQRDIYLDIDQRLSGSQGGGAASPDTGSSGPGTVPAEAPVVDDRPSAAPLMASGNNAKIKAEYQAAYDLLGTQNRRYDDAARAFAEFLKKYPNDPLAPNAQYWLGEANYVSRQYKTALDAFQTLIARYPDSTKIPGARLKIGYTYYELKNWSAARDTLMQVTKLYPDTTVATKANERLDRIKREGH